MSYKRILTIQDVSCVGKCSMTVALPILSACGHEVSILPTAVLSTHTGLSRTPAVHHMDASLAAMIHHWKELDIRFDMILTGYLGSVRAVREVLSIADGLMVSGGELIVDPAMADHGRMYSGLDDEYAQAMAELCRTADILLPNISEAAMLSGLAYRDMDESYVHDLLNGLPCSRAVLTGVGYIHGETGVEIRDNDVISAYRHRRFEKNYHGTGDIFAACFAGARGQGKDIFESAKIAANFTELAIEYTWKNPGNCFGVKFEPCLYRLHEMLNDHP